MPETHEAQAQSRGLQFWLILVALGCALCLVSIELTSISTALPAITKELASTDASFIWVSSSYTMASTAILPLSGGVSEIFGRRPAILSAVFLFCFGSALCGSATHLSWLIGARAVQGLGGGMILSITNIIIGDLVSLQERGFVSGILGLSWALSAAFGPLIGGAFANSGQWRWIFYMNIPISVLTALLLVMLLHLPTPPGTMKQKMAKMDWVGNALIITSTCSVVMALTWAGIIFPWSSLEVLLPLILGLVGQILLLLYEDRFAKSPIVPLKVISNCTSFSGYMQTFLSPTILLATIYYMPTYYQACKGDSPWKSGLHSLGLTIALGPASIIAGMSVTKSGKYHYQCYIGWSILVAGTGLLTMLDEESILSMAIALPALVSIGAGIIYSVAYFPVLAPLPPSHNAHALAFFAFCRSFAGVWGITIGGTILQNVLYKQLPAELSQSSTFGASFLYSDIQKIASLEEPLQLQVRNAFAEAIRAIWFAMLGVACIGLLSTIGMKVVQ
ncbi:major facilitator superfamily domain-containing protein [Lentinula novae-zelandiae]|nr:major facilitator superfamily domain-containing protein [Lentinula novae-zelandiae]